MVDPLDETKIAILGGTHREIQTKDILIFDTSQLTVKLKVSGKFPYTTEVSSCIKSEKGQILAIAKN